MKRFTITLLAVGLLAVSLTPATASADAIGERFAEFSKTEKYLGDNFSISSRGYRGKMEMLRAAAWDQSTCTAYAFNLRKTGSRYTRKMANELATQDHGSPAHEQCFRSVRRGLPKFKPTFKPFGRTKEYRRAKRRGKCTPKFCILKIEGRTKNGQHKWKRIKVKRGKRVMVWSVKKVKKVKGKWKPVGEPFGIGMGGCTNKMAQTFERVTTLRFKLRFSYAKTGKPKKKGKTPGPSGTGHSLPPALPPLTPPDNNEDGPTTPPDNIPGGGGPPNNGGCTNNKGESISCS